jgi:hypothetical protein
VRQEFRWFFLGSIYQKRHMVGVESVRTANHQCAERVRSNRSQEFCIPRFLEVVWQIHGGVSPRLKVNLTGQYPHGGRAVRSVCSGSSTVKRSPAMNGWSTIRSGPSHRNGGCTSCSDRSVEALQRRQSATCGRSALRSIAATDPFLSANCCSSPTRAKPSCRRSMAGLPIVSGVIQ